MAERDIDKLLGGYASGTLTDEERRRLFEAALHDQALFDALTREDALKEVLDDPKHRRRLLAALVARQQASRRPLNAVLEWFRRPANLTVAGTLAAAVIAVWVFVALERETVVTGPEKDRVVRLLQSRQRAEPKTEPSEAQDALEPSAAGGKLDFGGRGSEKRSAEVAQRVEGQVAREKAHSAGQAGTSSVSKPVTRSQPATPKPRPKRTDRKRTVAPAAKKKAVPRARAPAEAPALSKKNAFSAGPRKKRPRVARSVAPPGAGVEATPAWLTSHRGSVEPGPARQLFYARLAPARYWDTDEMSPSRDEEEERALEPSQQESSQLSPAVESIVGLEAGQSPRTFEPFGLRYSILKEDKDGDFKETSPEGPFNAYDAMRVTVEVNETGYLYVFRLGPRGEWLWISPAGPLGKEEQGSGGGVRSGKRYVIPGTGVLPFYDRPPANKLILIYSRQPLQELQVFHPAVLQRQEFDDRPSADLESLLNRARIETSTRPLFVEKIQPAQREGPQEHAVYIVNPAAGQDAAIAIELTFPSG